MERLSGKRSFVEMLRALGVAHVFGNPGSSEGPLLALLAEQSGLRYVPALQEGVAVGMGDGYARATGEPALVCLHCETGLANGLSLLINSFRGGTPLVLCSVNSDVRKVVEERLDLPQMVRQLTKWSLEVSRPELVPGVLRRAFDEARRSPSGPVYVSLSFNVLDEEAEVEIAPAPEWAGAVGPDPRAIAAAAELLGEEGPPPVLLVGDRVAHDGAVDEAVRLAERLQAEVYAGHLSEVTFPTGHRLYRGQLPLPGTPAAQEIFAPPGRILLAVGTNVLGGFSYLPGALGRLGIRLIHLDSDSREIGRCELTQVGVVGDVKRALAALVDALPKGRFPEDPGCLEEPAGARRGGGFPPAVPAGTAGKPMPALRLMAELARALPEEAILVEDAGTSAAALHRCFTFDRPGTLHGTRGGAIGWGMGAALGVQLARPDRPVVCVVGDGSAMMTVQALWTAVHERIPVVYVVCNNASYRILKLNLQRYYRKTQAREAPSSSFVGTDFSPPLDFAALAGALGARGWAIREPAGIAPALEEALSSRAPAVLDVAIDGAL